MSADALPVEIDSSSGKPIALLTLEQGDAPVVVMNEALLRRLDAALAELPDEAQGLVIRSASERAFVAGADLRSIVDLDDDALSRYLAYGQEVFGKIADLPYPTAAAINGAALGGGLELAMHCDGLIAAPAASGKPYPVGLPEASLGICPGWGGSNLLPARVDPAEGFRRACTGEPMKFDEAAEAGLFDDVAAEASELVRSAVSWVALREGIGRDPQDAEPLRWVGRPDGRAGVQEALDSVRPDLPETAAAAAVADCVDAGLTEGWKPALRREIEHLVGLRSTETARSAIEAFFSKSKK